MVSETTPAANLLRELRRRQDRSLREAAKDLGVAPSQLSRVERGERTLNDEITERVAKYYGVSSDLVLLAEGRLPDDVREILQKHPELLDRLREWGGQLGQSGGDGQDG